MLGADLLFERENFDERHEHVSCVWITLGLSDHARVAVDRAMAPCTHGLDVDA